MNFGNFNRTDRVVYGIGVGCVFAFFALLYAVHLKNNEWREFAASHDCKVVAESNGTVGYGVMSNGKFGAMGTAGTTTYVCNDGVQYTR